MTPPRLRRNPRDRTRRRGLAPAAAPQVEPVVTVPEPAGHVLAVVSLEAGRLSRMDRDLMGAARQLAGLNGDAAVMVAFLPERTALRARPDREGADRLVVFHDDAFGDDLAEARVGGVLAAASACAARHILFSEDFLGAELGRRVAARLGDRAAFGVRRFSRDGLLATIDGGATEISRPLPRVMLIAPGTFEPAPESPRREAREVAVQVLVSPPPRVRALGALPLDPASIPLAEADLIISAGSGLTDWVSFHNASAALGAAEAGSRVVCDAGLLPRSSQVGASGLLVKPRCYLAFGIAGASQHLQGIAEAERVVAVNTDLRADMIKRADLAIVADAQLVLPALVRRAAARKIALHGAAAGPGETPDAP